MIATILLASAERPLLDSGIFPGTHIDDRSDMVLINCTRRRSCMFVIYELGYETVQIERFNLGTKMNAEKEVPISGSKWEVEVHVFGVNFVMWVVCQSAPQNLFGGVNCHLGANLGLRR